MKTLKIVTTKPNRLGAKLIVSSLGTIDIPTDGVIEVDEEIAKDLVERGFGWEYVKESTKGAKKEAIKEEVIKEEVKEVVLDVVDAIVEGDVVVEAKIEDTSLEMLNDMTAKELKSMLSELECDINEYESMKKAELIEYAKNKLA
jgi:hypothetical protein